MSLSNLYAYGALAWDPYRDSQDILQSWTRLTFGLDTDILDVVDEISMQSWPAYENYTGNLGIQTLTNILYTHFGPGPESQDGNGYGQWTRADLDSVGMDRTCSNGTCFAGQYPPEIASMYESLSEIEDNLVLWFHHVNWTYVLHSGKTVIQHFYDAHYAGAETAQTFVTELATLEGKIDTERFDNMMYQQTFQAGHSIVWRDAIVDYYWNMTNIADEQGRVGNHPWRVPVSSMELDGYKPYVVNPFEMATPPNYTAVVTKSNSTTGTASTQLQYPSGTYDVAINYYDLYGGVSTWNLYLNDNMIEQWKGNAEHFLGHTPSIYLDGHTAIRKTFHDINITKGDMLKIVGMPNGVEPAPLDYISVLPQGVVD